MAGVSRLDAAEKRDEQGGSPPHRVIIVGTGSGDPAQLTPEAGRVIAASRFLAGGRRQLELAPAAAETCVIDADLEGVQNFISSKLASGDVCVMTSGDPGCFSILTFLARHFAGNITVVPGISSVQMLAARLGAPWHDWQFHSVHGRGLEAGIRRPSMTTVFFCDGDNPPAAVAASLLDTMDDCPAAVGADLGTGDEKVFEGTLTEVAASTISGNSMLLVKPPLATATAPGANAAAPGIPDELWVRAEGVPMSKSEVRAVLMGKAQPASHSVIWDIGAGTGSYSVECALLSPHARVIAIEKDPEAGSAIRENSAKFGASVEVITGEAPGCFARLPAPDLAIIGGNDGRLDEIFASTLDALQPGGRLLVTAVLERTSKAAHQLFAHSGLQYRAATRVSVERGHKTQWEEQNPVTIFTGDKGI